MRTVVFRVILAVCCTALTACSPKQSSDPGLTPVFHNTDNPAVLGSWGQVAVQDGKLQLADAVMPYDLNTPLFSDYAHKLRTVWLPDDTFADYREDESLNFPIGTIITKTFYYPVPQRTGNIGNKILKKQTPIPLDRHALPLENIRLIETRILARRDSGWVALPYVWNEEQTEARLQRTGDLKKLSLVSEDKPDRDFAYLVPNANQCAGCHATNNTTRQIQPIGLKPRHLNRNFTYETGQENQLTQWQKKGLLKGAPAAEEAPHNAVWTDKTVSLDARARAYLDINCSHCHNKVGPADTSGLHLEPDTPTSPNLGLCKLPVAAGSGTGNRRFDIHPGAPDDSIFIYRMASTDPGAMMPELGRALAHDEGVQLVREWISALDGSCG